MNNHELDALLKSVPPPARDNEYWQTFPEVVRRELPAQTRRPMAVMRPQWGWTIGFASACLATALLLAWKFGGAGVQREAQLRVLGQSYREAAALFPQQLQAVVLESGQFHLQLAEQPMGASAPPLFVRICKAKQCATAITFSGQEIDLLGRKFEVLADGRGGVILLSQGVVWTTGQTTVGEQWRFETAWLEERL